MQLKLADPEATEALGAALAVTRPPSAIIHLHGNLGAGKSTLARALLRRLGVRGAIRSPTYTLIEPYRLENGDEAVHLDLYRIAAPDELDFLGLDGLAEQASLWLVEWPEKGGKALPQADLRVQLEVDGEGRNVLLEGPSSRGAAWLDRLAGEYKMAHLSVVDSR